jgi:hypothetical protein
MVFGGLGLRNRLFAAVALAGAVVWAAVADAPAIPPYLFTSAPRYEPQAWLAGRDRFPSGATLTLVSGAKRRPLVSGFYASADAVVFYDGTKALFAGKREGTGHWQVWETAIESGVPRQITTGDSDCIRPLYVPDGRIVYTRLSAQGSAIEIVPLAGGKAERLTYAPGWVLTSDLLRDGRILFEYSVAGRTRELYTVYPDGTGVEALRCDHGPDRSGARQISSGDVIFAAGGRLARFTSALASQAEVAQPKGEPSGPIAEITAGRWIVPLRTGNTGPFGLVVWDAATAQTRELEASRDVNAVEPAMVAARVPPRDFPSALVATRTAGNLLCLNVRQSKTPLAGDVSAVRVYARGADGAPVPLGQAPVESDGSFYVQVPADQPLRMELLDASGRSVRAERDWFWMRPSEQRICVGCHAGPERAPENRLPEVLLHSTIPVKMLGGSGRTQ